MMRVPSPAMASTWSAAAMMPATEPPLSQVDERVEAVEEHVAHVHHVGLAEVHHRVAVGVRGRHVEGVDLVAVEVERDVVA